MLSGSGRLGSDVHAITVTGASLCQRCLPISVIFFSTTADTPCGCTGKHRSEIFIPIFAYGLARHERGCSAGTNRPLAGPWRPTYDLYDWHRDVNARLKALHTRIKRIDATA
jgi:hypothetical protein